MIMSTETVKQTGEVTTTCNVSTITEELNDAGLNLVPSKVPTVPGNQEETDDDKVVQNKEPLMSLPENRNSNSTSAELSTNAVSICEGIGTFQRDTEKSLQRIKDNSQEDTDITKVSTESHSMDRTTNVCNSIQHEKEIKEEVLEGYSVEGWCELGPSAHAQGHSPVPIEIDKKDEIKKSPRTDDDTEDKPSIPLDKNVVHKEIFPTLTDWHENPSHPCFSFRTGNQKLVPEYNGTGCFPTTRSEALKISERIADLPNSGMCQLAFWNETKYSVKKEITSPSREQRCPTSESDPTKYNQLKQLSDAYNSLPDSNQEVEISPKSPVCTPIPGILSPNSRTQDLPRQYFPLNLNQAPFYTPSPSAEMMRVGSYPYSPFVFQQRSANVAYPLTSQNAGNVLKLQEPQEETLRLFQTPAISMMSGSHHNTFTTSPNSIGYFRYPTIQQSNNVMFLSPQSLFFQQLPYPSPIFHHTSYQSCGSTPLDSWKPERRDNSCATSSLAKGDTDNNISKEEKVQLKRKLYEMETTEKISDVEGTREQDSEEPKETNVYAESNHNNKIPKLDKPDDNVEDPLTEKCDSEGMVAVEKTANDERIKSSASESEIQLVEEKSIDNDKTTAELLVGLLRGSKSNGNGEKEKGRKHTGVAPKMAGGADFVDPTRIKLDHDDEMEDNDMLERSDDDTSDEDWMPKKRDGGKGYDVKRSEKAEQSEEEDEEIEESIGVLQKKWLGNILKSNSKKGKQFSTAMECQDCGKVFHGSYHLKRHRLSHTENRPHQCTTCGKRFKQKAHLHGHETVHLREKTKSTGKTICQDLKIKLSPNKCPGRPKKVYSEKELSCSICSKVFKTLYRLKRHVQSHTDLRPYTCKVCGKGFKQTGHRNEHEANHEKNRRKFLCNMCGVIFRCRSSFNNHLKTHRFNAKGKMRACDGTSPNDNQEENKLEEEEEEEMLHTGYDCPYCTDKFATAQGLNRHLESHIEVHQRLHVQPYSCQVCCRSFTYKHNLTKHMLTHQAPEKYAEFHKSKLEEHLASGKPSYTCSVCSKVFIRKETLAKHSKIHTGSKPFKCLVCQKEFTQNVHMKVHMRKHTGNRPFQCKRCNRGFIDSTALAKHIEYEACNTENVLYHCNICEKRHYYLGSIKQHIKKEHNESDVDKFITRTQRQRRQRVATVKTDTVCKICSTSFSEKGNLIRHVKRKHGDLLKMLNNDLAQVAFLSGPKIEWQNETMPGERCKAEVVKTESLEEFPNVLDIKRQHPCNVYTENIQCTADPKDTQKMLQGNSSMYIPFVKTNVESPPVNDKSDFADVRTETKTNIASSSAEISSSNTEKEANLEENTPFGEISRDHFGNVNQRITVPESDHTTFIVNVDQTGVTGEKEMKSGSKPTIQQHPNFSSPLVNKTTNQPTNTLDTFTDTSSLRIDKKESERNEMINELNVGSFLYHVGLVEKVKDTTSESSESANKISRESIYSRPYMMQEMSGSLEKPRDLGYDLCFRNNKMKEFENPPISGRTNLEVFCDVALMAENRNMFFANNEGTGIVFDTNNGYKSSYLNEFQTTAQSQPETKIENAESSVTESQLRELGLLVCKDAQSVKNNQRGSEEIYAEFRPWLEQLVWNSSTRPQVCTANNFVSNDSIPKITNESPLPVSETYSEPQVKMNLNDTTKSCLLNECNPLVSDLTKPLQSQPDAYRGNSHLAISNHDAYLRQETKPSVRPRSKSDAMIYTHPDFSTPAMSLIHSTTLRQQLSSHSRQETNHSQTLPLSVAVSGKEASVQTPLYINPSGFQTNFRSSSSNSRGASCSGGSNHSKVPSRNVAEESKILHSLLGGMKTNNALYDKQKCENRKDSNNSNGAFVPKLIAENVSFIPVNPMEPMSPYHVTRGKSQGKNKGPFPCQGCGKCFNARHQLKRHEMTHTEIRPYRCGECGKAFRQKVHLSDHLKRHRGQRPFLCQACGKRFVLKNELKQHIKNYCRRDGVGRVDNGGSGDSSSCTSASSISNNNVISSS